MARKFPCHGQYEGDSQVGRQWAKNDEYHVNSDSYSKKLFEETPRIVGSNPTLPPSYAFITQLVE